MKISAEECNARIKVQLQRLERKFKKKSNKELLLQLKEMTAELRAMTGRINEMNRTITDIRQNLRGEV